MEMIVCFTDFTTKNIAATTENISNIKVINILINSVVSNTFVTGQ